MSRILFSTVGSLGDLHPYLAIARELIGRGHEAVIATSGAHADAVRAAGVGLAEIGPDIETLGDYPTFVQRMFDPRQGPERLIRQVVMPHIRESYEALMDASEGIDLLVSQTLAMTVPIVAERRRLPWAATMLAPMAFMSAYDPPLVPLVPWLFRLRFLGPGLHRRAHDLYKRRIWEWEAPLRALRRELGVSPLTKLALFEGQYSPDLNLALFDAELADPQPDWPDKTEICGNPVYDGAPLDATLAGELERFLADGEPPIVFALGSSAVWIAGDFWDHAAAAATRLGRRALLLTGPTTPEGLPDGVTAFRYLPYSSVFPSSAAVVHQAGIGTLARAMRSGRPQLIVPVAFDQPDNARRAAGLGVARTLPFRKVTTERLTAELSALLEGPGYRRSAQQLAERLSGRRGAARAADALLALLPERATGRQRPA